MSGFVALNDLLKPEEGDEAKGRWYLGTVRQVSPDGTGMVKAHVPGLFDMDAGDVPWIGQLKQSLFGVGAGFGMYGAAQPGAKVTVILQDGDPNYPAYIGGVLNKDDVPDEFKSPSVWGFKDPKGNKLVVDLASGTFRFTHSSGAYISFDGGGNIIIKGTTIQLNPA
ncbi:baseplate hub subunit [Burkholderia phage BCSR5]|nr:baseplate hub subunit [Burkholderia phage BCSR5]